MAEIQKIMIVAAPFYENIAEQLIAGATQVIEQEGFEPFVSMKGVLCSI